MTQPRDWFPYRCVGVQPAADFYTSTGVAAKWTERATSPQSGHLPRSSARSKDMVMGAVKDSGRIVVSSRLPTSTGMLLGTHSCRELQPTRVVNFMVFMARNRVHASRQVVEERPTRLRCLGSQRWTSN